MLTLIRKIKDKRIKKESLLNHDKTFCLFQFCKGLLFIFRCGIPVIIMGETGCGKTRLIKFMCDLQRPPEYLLPTIDNKVETKVEKVDDHENDEKNDNHENAEIEINEPTEDEDNLKNVETEQNKPNEDDDIQVCYGRIHKQEENTKLHIQNMILMKVNKFFRSS